MGAEGAPDVRVAVAQGQQVVRLGQLDGGHQEADDAALAGTVQRRLALVRRQVLQVAVGVDEARHRTSVPGGTSRSGWSSTGWPSSEAASTMPRDSTPISLAGCRLATTTTWRPTSDSGS